MRIAVMLGRYRLAYAQAYRSREFRGQAPDKFGTLSLSTAF